MAPPERADVDMRRRILALVHDYPGLHLRELQRRAETSATLVEYHLNVLERLSLVTSTEEGGYRRFFPARGARTPLGKTEKSWLGLLRQQVPFGITLHLLEHGSAIHKDLVAVVTVTKSTLTYHLKNMEALRLVERDPPVTGRLFRLSNPEIVLALLRAYAPTPDLVASYGDMWAQIFGALEAPADDDAPPRA